MDPTYIHIPSFIIKCEWNEIVDGVHLSKIVNVK